jgi:hypothetical protein
MRDLWKSWHCNNFSPSTSESESESESYITTDGQSASMSWNKAPIWGLRPDLDYCQLQVCWFGAPFLTRDRICPLYMLLALASAVFLGSESLGIWDHILLSQIWDFPFRRLATSATWATEKTALLLLRAFASVRMCLPNRCLAMNYSCFQVSYHNMIDAVVFIYINLHAKFNNRRKTEEYSNYLLLFRYLRHLALCSAKTLIQCSQ